MLLPRALACLNAAIPAKHQRGSRKNSQPHETAYAFIAHRRRSSLEVLEARRVFCGHHERSTTHDHRIASRVLSGAAAGTAGIAAASAFGAPVATQASAAETTATAQNAVVNPQDYSYTTNSIEDFSKSALFSEWEMGGRTFHHRMVKSAAFQLAFLAANPDEYINYYLRMAKGGVEMIWIEDAANMWEMTASSLKQDYSAYDMKGLVDALHAEGCTVGYQFDTMGAPIGPLDYTAPFIGDYSTEEIQSWEQVVIDIAKTLQADGFDAIELNMAANNMGQSFLSRARNNRTDEYGAQSLENRTRWAVETIRGIKEACGDGFMVQALINGVESNDADLGNDALMTTVEENRAIAKILEEAGADSLHVRIGPGYTHIAQFAGDLYFCANGLEGANSQSGRYDFDRHFQGLVRGNNSGCGLTLDIAAAIREAVSIPVGCATYNDPAQAPDLFEAAIVDGKVDFLIMNRPLCVDPNYVNKLREGRIDEIAPCTRCLHCFYDADQSGLCIEHCRVNAANWRAYGPAMPEGFDPAPAQQVKKVLVAGGGPAGMEAARVAAERGHTVVLCEKTGSLGGTLPIAEAIKGPHENLGRLATYLAKQLEVAGVEVRLDTEVDAALVSAEAPDAVIWACGAVEAEPLPGTVGFSDVPGLRDAQRVVVLGSSARAVDTAVYLVKEGKDVTIVTPDPMEAFEKGHSVNVRSFIQNALTSAGVRIWPDAANVQVAEGAVEFASASIGVDFSVPCDAVVDLLDMLPNPPADLGVETVVVGDAAAPFNIAEAISSANLAARAI